jgi:CDP-diacylglycerol--glycerol-3-phosphate 3-phosphatidyltransferase
MLTFAGLILSAATAACIAQGYLLASGLLLLLAGGFDMADGALARVAGAGSDFGDFLDATFDRLSEAGIGLGLLWHALARQDNLQAGLVYAVAMGSVVTSYARARAEVLSLKCEVGPMARPERVIILAFGLILAQAVGEMALTITLTLLCLFVWLTTVQRILHVYRLTTRNHQV